MSRGYCIEFNKDISSCVCLEKNDLYEHLSSLGIDYVQDVDEETKENVVTSYIDWFKKCGAETGVEEDERWRDGEIRNLSIPYVIFTDDVKRSYFRKQFDEMKELAKKISLDDFALKDPYDLRMKICDNYSDCVYYDYPKSMDYFIREAENGIKYYIGNVINMH